VTALLWRATGCVDGPSPPEGLTLAAGSPWQELGTPALLSGLWGSAQALVAGDGGPRLQGQEIAVVHEALVVAWRVLRDGPTRGPGLPFPWAGAGAVRVGRSDDDASPRLPCDEGRGDGECYTRRAQRGAPL